MLLLSTHKNLIIACTSQFPDNRGICKSIFEHKYSTNNIIIRGDYFFTNFVYLKQHPPGISTHLPWYRLKNSGNVYTIFVKVKLFFELLYKM